MLFDAFRQEILDHLSTVLGNIAPSELTLELPPELKMGDFAFPTFRLAKALKKAPPLIAQEVHQKLMAIPAIQQHYDVALAGPYVNFTIKKDFLLKTTLGDLLFSRQQLAQTTQAQPKTVLLEFSSPNVAKPFNIYHLRSTMVGNSLYRIYKARGYHAVAINHLGDWGTQYGTLALAFQKWGNQQELEERGISYLVELYVRINKEIETNPELATTARENFAKLERGDSAITQLWKQFVDLSLKEFKKTYDRLGVHFDYYWGESFYSDKIAKIEAILKEKQLLVHDEGADVIKLDQFQMPACLFRKQDGSTIYATRDLAAALFRYEQFKFDRSLYIVGGEQKLHFAQVFKVLELAGFAWAKQCQHIDLGLYRFKDAKMSTRKGNFVTMEAVLDQAVERAATIIAEKNPELNDREKNSIAEIIGVGAVVYNDLSTDRSNVVNFDLEQVLDFDGETGPYIQYAHTRCHGILRNAPANLLVGISVDKLADLSFEQPGFQALWQAAQSKLNASEELDLIRVLAKLPLVLDIVLVDSRPSVLANFLIEVTKQFGVFYRNQKVLVEDSELAQARLALVLATQRTLLKGVELLGMQVPQKM